MVAARLQSACRDHGRGTWPVGAWCPDRPGWSWLVRTHGSTANGWYLVDLMTEGYTGNGVGDDV